MPRMPRPWRRKSGDGAWYAQVDCQQCRLAGPDATYDEAEAVLLQLRANKPLPPPRASDGLSVGQVVALFVQDSRGKAERGELSPATFEHYGHHMQRFASALGDTAVAQLRPIDVTAWLDKNPRWGSTMRAGAITAVKRCFRWAFRQGVIAANPIEGLEKPQADRRTEVPSPEVFRKALDAVQSPEFALFLRVLFETGCRPGEARSVCAADIDWKRHRWARAGKTTRLTKRPRIVHLTDDLVQVFRELSAKHSTGPLLRNTQGVPWTQTAINTQMRRLRARLGNKAAFKNVVPYALRHLFVTDALDRGVDVADVATLVGHSTTKMIMDRYSHLVDRHDHMRAALARVRG